MDVDPGFWNGRRVLITGHTGFKGSWLVQWLLAMGAHVSGYSRDIPTEPSLYRLAGVGEHVESVEADVRDHEAVARALRSARPEIVVHMAAQSLVRRSLRDPRETYETNVLGTVNVLEAVRLSQEARVVIVVTSDKCYENREWEWGYREDEPLGGRDPYSSSKAAAELVTAAYRRSYFDGSGAHARIASVRAGNAIGGGDWGEDRLVPDAMRAALAGETLRVRAPDAIRSWQHVLNPLSGYLGLAQGLWDRPELASAWNFGPGDDDARSVSWLLEQIAGRWAGGLRWEIDPAPHPPEAHRLTLDSTRARALLGWRPHWDLGEGIDAVVEWYESHTAGAAAAETTLAQIDRFAAS